MLNDDLRTAVFYGPISDGSTHAFLWSLPCAHCARAVQQQRNGACAFATFTEATTLCHVLRGRPVTLLLPSRTSRRFCSHCTLHLLCRKGRPQRCVLVCCPCLPAFVISFAYVSWSKGRTCKPAAYCPTVSFHAPGMYARVLCSRWIVPHEYSLTASVASQRQR